MKESIPEPLVDGLAFCLGFHPRSLCLLAQARRMQKEQYLILKKFL